MKRPLYVDGAFVALVDCDGEPKLPEGCDLWTVAKHAETQPMTADLTTHELRHVLVEDHDAKCWRYEWQAVKLDPLAIEARARKALGGGGIRQALLDLQNQIRALRNEPPLTAEQFTALFKAG